MEGEETTVAAHASYSSSIPSSTVHIDEKSHGSSSEGGEATITPTSTDCGDGEDIGSYRGDNESNSKGHRRPNIHNPPKSILRRGKHGSARVITATAADDEDKKHTAATASGWGTHLVQNLLSDTTAYSYLSNWTQPAEAAESAQAEAKGTRTVLESSSDDEDSDSDSLGRSRRLPVRFAIHPPTHTSLIDFSKPLAVGRPTGSHIAVSSNKSGHNPASEVDSTIGSIDHGEGVKQPSTRHRLHPGPTTSTNAFVPPDYQEFLHQVHLEAIKMAEELRLLRKMLSERDERISSLADEIDSARAEKENVDLQIDEAQRLLEEDSLTHRSTLEDYTADEEGCRHAMEQLEYEMKQSAKLFEYTKLLKEAAAKQASARNGAGVQDSTYLIRLQSQLMKSMHSMGMLDNQLKLYQSQCSGMAKSLRDETSRIVEEKSMAELRMMNELGSVHGQMRENEEELSDILEAKRAELVELERLLMDKFGHHIDEDGSEDSENDKSDRLDGEGVESNGPSHEDERIDATPVEKGKPTSHADADTLLLDEEIERVRHQIQTLSTERDSMVEHLSIAIAEKDEILRQMRETP